MNGFFSTDKGQVRNHNEDSGGLFYNQSNQLLAVIADGMGGHKAGDVASQMATQALREQWEQKDEIPSPDVAEEWLRSTITEINETVFSFAQENEDCKGMGTTIVSVICTDEFVTVAHIGDSRCYLANNQGFKQITEDHSLVNELVRSGQITKDDAEHHPRKNVLLKALGTEQAVGMDVQSIGWDKNNKLLLCSDGLSNKIEEHELQAYLEEEISLQEIAEKLVYIANERGGEDNISLVLVAYDGTAEEGDS
ncbi:Stp1/IreP family PP2C-type Ser/Thr phosphatase [Radiobacillus kanasensis]|uniref:Stp1/IreP family PP2C-type Ser/Thr phosphatase n=1 Tax=Radiobacillus kanasensis TaxID=2844358 RepID=UPI001E5129A8|nr:Stp1/IreP family PP2C-type Ser/Thr phosphatase [Radiobacillus kanasensis]UFU00982.1 Stp1/IreP family PP2C-type Ser/Thr phosphatase [Radiobacillus kanasensis]